MNTFRSGSRVPARSAAARSPLEERGGAGHVGAPLARSCSVTACVGIPALHQHGGGAEQQRAFEGVDRSADVGDRGGHQERVAGLDRASARRSGGSARGSNYGCAERLWAVRWCRRCRGSSAPRRGPAPAVDAVVAAEQVGEARSARPAPHRAPRRPRAARPSRRSPGPASRRSRGRRTRPGRRSFGTSASARMNAQLVVAQRRQDGVDHHAGQRRAEVDDGGLVPVGQHEGHHAADRASAPAARRPVRSACVAGFGSPAGVAVDEDLRAGVTAAARRSASASVSATQSPLAYASAARRDPWHVRDCQPLTRRIVIEWRNRDDGMGVDGDLGDLPVRGRVACAASAARAVPGSTLSASASSGVISTAAISWCTSTMLTPKRSSISGKIGPVWRCSIRPDRGEGPVDVVLGAADRGVGVLGLPDTRAPQAIPRRRAGRCERPARASMVTIVMDSIANWAPVAKASRSLIDIDVLRIGVRGRPRDDQGAGARARRRRGCRRAAGAAPRAPCSG